MIFEISYGELPFDGNSPSVLRTNVVHGPLVFRATIPRFVAFTPFLGAMPEKDFTNRWSARELLGHEFLADFTPIPVRDYGLGYFLLTKIRLIVSGVKKNKRSTARMKINEQSNAALSLNVLHDIANAPVSNDDPGCPTQRAQPSSVAEVSHS
jgi:serine/threonine protein kinase